MSATLQSRLPQIIAELEGKARAIEGAGAGIVERSAKVRAPDAHPLDEGLVSAIHTEREENGVYVVAGDSDTFYGHMVENGTSHSAPQPFLVPALEESRGKILAMARASLRDL